MKRLVTLLAMIFIIGNVMGQTWFGPSYVHINYGSNCLGDYTILDSTAIGNNTSDIIIFSHVWGLYGEVTHEEYMKKSCGLWFTGTNWSIFDETRVAMDTNYAFNVLNAKANGTGFTHTVTSSNLVENFSTIDNPILNGHPDLVFFITKTWTNGVYDTAHVGIWYDAGAGQWSVYNEAGPASTLQLNSTYNIFVPNPGTSFIKQVATSNYYITTIDDTRLNGNPLARIYAVHDYTTTSGTQGYVNDEIGVWYDGSNWTVYTENISDLFTGATFNVLIASDAIPGIPVNKEETNNLKVFPNPAKDKLGVLLNTKLSMENATYRLVSTDGRTIFEKHATGNMNGQVFFDVHDLSAGLYFLYATTSGGIISAKVNIVK